MLVILITEAKQASCCYKPIATLEDKKYYLLVLQRTVSFKNGQQKDQVKQCYLTYRPHRHLDS